MGLIVPVVEGIVPEGIGVIVPEGVGLGAGAVSANIVAGIARMVATVHTAARFLRMEGSFFMSAFRSNGAMWLREFIVPLISRNFPPALIGFFLTAHITARGDMGV